MRGVPGPPPPPRAATEDAGRDEFRAELRALETPELLALCARFGRDPARLAFYLALFRARSGERAQFAACLVCFDIARQGSQAAQREFHALAPTMVAIAQDPAVVAELLAGDPYLEAQWQECQRALRHTDPRDTLLEPVEEVEIVGEVDLLSQEAIDLGDLEARFKEPPEERALCEREEFLRILDAKLGRDLEQGQIFSGEGFAVESRAELDRFERFVAEAASRAERVPIAAGMACLGNLYLAAHLRRTSFFGGANPRRIAAVQAGLGSLARAHPGAVGATSLFALEGAPIIERFEKVTELLIDFIRFCAAERLDPLGSESAEHYARVNREPEPLLNARKGRRRR
jgi:hypothetical protein